MTTKNDEDDVVIDIADHVVRYARDQGHLKATRKGVKWSGMRTFCHPPTFERPQVVREREEVVREDQLTPPDHPHLHLSPAPPLLSNVSDRDVTAHVTSNKKPLRFARFKLRTALACDARQLANDNKHLAPLKLAPRFPGHHIDPHDTGWSRLDLAHDPPGCEVRVAANGRVLLDVRRREVVERGTFACLYRVWGHVTVTVWGKKYRLPITDILDRPDQGLLRRRRSYTSPKDAAAASSSAGEKQEIEYTLRGEYEIHTTTYSISVRKNPSPFRITSPKINKLACTCDLTRLPRLDNGKLKQLKPLTNINVARIFVTWKQIQRSLESLEAGTLSDAELWRNLGGIGKISAICRDVERQCPADSVAMDKMAVAMLAWKAGCASIQEYSQSERGDPNNSTPEMSRQAMEILHQAGMPVAAFHCLYKDHSTDDAEAECQLHWGESKTEQMRKDRHRSCKERLIRMEKHKINQPLPDRVILRLINEWEADDGWAVAAVHMDIDPLNLSNLSKDTGDGRVVQKRELSDKRLIVFRLWRMTQRSKLHRHCTTLDWCLLLNKMQLDPRKYEFCWNENDAETTP